MLTAQVDMKSIIYKLATLYVACCDDRRAARDVGKVAPLCAGAATVRTCAGLRRNASGSMEQQQGQEAE